MLLSSLVAQASPLSEQQVSQLQGLISQLNPIQQAWVSGYLAASAQLAAQGSVVPAQAATAASLTILFGSQTGNARQQKYRCKRELNAQIDQIGCTNPFNSVKNPLRLFD